MGRGDAWRKLKSLHAQAGLVIGVSCEPRYSAQRTRCSHVAMPDLIFSFDKTYLIFYMKLPYWQHFLIFLNTLSAINMSVAHLQHAHSKFAISARSSVLP